MDSEDQLWFIARGFVPGERVSRTIRVPESKAIPDQLEADTRGVVVWTLHLEPGTRYAPREVELRGRAGTCSGKYSVRAL